MLKFIVAAPVVLGGVFVGGVLLGLALQEPLRRRAAKSVVKTTIGGVHAIGDRYQALKEDIEDARAEAAFKRHSSGSSTPHASESFN